MLVPKSSTKQLLEEATQAYEKQLQTDDEALTYLASRGISKKAQDFFRLGVVRECYEGQENYLNRISFPYITPSSVVSIRFRTIGPPGGKSKFLYLPGEIPRIYNTRALMGSKEVFICEGETDTIAAWSAGLSVVGLPGAKTWSSNSRVFSRVFANRTVTVLADNDDVRVLPDGSEDRPGRDLADEIYRTLGGCRVILMEQGYDVSKFISERGTQAFLEKIK